MKKIVLLSTLAAAATMVAMPASAMDILARVISSTPVVQQVAVPRQVCNNQPVLTQAPKSGAGALLGAVAGGAAGNAIGNGNGRALATMIGLFGGAVVGNNIEGSNSQVQNVTQCSTQTYYENRPSHYNVVYEYQGTQYSTQLAHDPGLYMRLQVTPVGAVTPAPQAQAAQPETYYQPAPVQRQQPVYVQPGVVVGAPVVYAAPAYNAPAYYAPSYYAPSYYAPSYYPPVGLSLNFGYSRGFGGGYGGGYGYGGHGRWR